MYRQGPRRANVKIAGPVGIQKLKTSHTKLTKILVYDSGERLVFPFSFGGTGIKRIRQVGTGIKRLRPQEFPKVLDVFLNLFRFLFRFQKAKSLILLRCSDVLMVNNIGVGFEIREVERFFFAM
jgi:hypothetical protein